MFEELDNLYLIWLYSNFGNVTQKNPRRTYWKLARKLFTTEFVWFVPNDDARVEDGRDLRYEFLVAAEIPFVDPEWLNLGCSFLEMLIGLSRRLEFITEKPADYWFWELVENMGLRKYNDAHRGSIDQVTDETTDRVTWRTYDPDGHGGLFPLRNPKEDQTQVEIWYQMNAYILENEGEEA